MKKPRWYEISMRGQKMSTPELRRAAVLDGYPLSQSRRWIDKQIAEKKIRRRGYGKYELLLTGQPR